MTDYRNYEIELQLFLKFIDDNPYLKGLLSSLNASNEVEFDRWKAEVANDRGTSFPASETERAKLCFGILKECAHGREGHSAVTWGQNFSAECELNEILNDLNDAVLVPFVNYLDDRIDESGNILYLLHRFKLRAEWFQRQRLLELYRTDTGRGEAELDRALREALFDGGIDYPFSQPVSPSGRADVVSLDDVDDPLVLEVKVFDPARGKSANNLRQGFHQVLRYSSDYQQTVGYLTVFNCSESQLVLPTEDSSEVALAPRIVYDGKTFFLIAIELGADRESASREKTSARVMISRSDLVSEHS